MRGQAWSRKESSSWLHWWLELLKTSRSGWRLGASVCLGHGQDPPEEELVLSCAAGLSTFISPKGIFSHIYFILEEAVF